MRASLLLVVAACGSVSSKDRTDAAAMPDAPGATVDGYRSGSRLKLSWWTYDDGTRTYAGLHDTMLGTDCEPGQVAGATVCMPDAMQGYYFADAACTQPVGDWYICNNQTPGYIYTSAVTGGACPSSIAHVYQRGAQLQATTVYYLNGTACQQTTLSTMDAVYALGAEVAVGSLAPMAMAEGSGTSGFSVTYATSPDGAQLPMSLHDNSDGYDCDPESAAEGATTGTCIPEVTTAYAGYFASSTCTTALAEYPSACAAPMNAIVPAQCPGTFAQYYALGAPQAISTYYTESGTTCVAETAPAGTAWYALGTQLSVGSLARAPDTAAGHRMQLIHYSAGATSFRDARVFDTGEGTEVEVYQNSDGSHVALPASYNGFVQSNYFYGDAACTSQIDVVEIQHGAASCAEPPLPMYVVKYGTTPNGCNDALEVHTVGPAITVYLEIGANCVAQTPGSYEYHALGAAVAISSFESPTISVDP